jgi:D-arabinose 1-dehydrogenase-like Zn-dependent alcohol dehydrogenase
MKAAVMEAEGEPLVIREVPEPRCLPDGAIVRVEASGICRSDWHLWSGDWSWRGLRLPMPLVMGHEFSGVVEETGPEVRQLHRGDHVVALASQGDGTCPFCRDGLVSHCQSSITPEVHYQGGLARYVAVPLADLNLTKLPPALDFIESSPLGRRFRTGFHAMVDRAQVKPGEWVAVFGCGGVGLSAIHVAAALGASVIAISRDPRKLELASNLGAAHTIDCSRKDPIAAVMDLTGGGAHVAADAVGIPDTCRAAILSMRVRGRHLQLGVTGSATRGEMSIPLDRISLMELQVVGSLGIRSSLYPLLLRMVESRKLNPRAIVSETIRLEQAGEVLERMTKYRTIGFSVVNRF